MEWKHQFGVSEAALLEALKLAGVPVSVHVLKDALFQSGLYFEEVHCCPISHLAFTDEFSTFTICLLKDLHKKYMRMANRDPESV